MSFSAGTCLTLAAGGAFGCSLTARTCVLWPTSRPVLWRTDSGPAGLYSPRTRQAASNRRTLTASHGNDRHDQEQLDAGARPCSCASSHRFGRHQHADLGAGAGTGALSGGVDVCTNGQSNQSLQTCLREADADYARASRSGLDDGAVDHARNALLRCERLPPDQGARPASTACRALAPSAAA